jgi:hypothetical protein
VRILQVRAEDARIVWPEIKGYMEKTVKRVEHLYDAENILEEVEQARTALLVAEEDGVVYGAATIRITSFPKAKVASVDFVCGTKMQTWIKKLIRAIDIYAKENGCKYTDAVGRDGWIKIWGADKKGTWVVREI